MGKLLAMAAVGGVLTALCTGCPPAVTGDAAVADAGPLDTGANDRGRTDGATGDSGGATCGNVNSLGACQGALLVTCDADHNQLITFDCSTIASGVTCGLTDCDGDPDSCWGYDCVTGADGECDENFGAADAVFCDIDQQLGCIDGTCQSAPVCDPATFVNSCSNNSLRECWSGRESTYDCDTAQCGADSHGRIYCLGTEGGGCDLTHAPPFECSAGLSCSSTTAAGRCLSATPDGG